MVTPVCVHVHVVVLAQVFEDTSLSSVYGCTNQPSQQQLARMQPLLDAAAAVLGRPVQLPTITHAPGFDKYRHLAPGEAAHEAGYGEWTVSGGCRQGAGCCPALLQLVPRLVRGGSGACTGLSQHPAAA